MDELFTKKKKSDEVDMISGMEDREFCGLT